MGSTKDPFGGTPMQVNVDVRLVVSISNEGCSVDELCARIGAVLGPIGVKVAEKVIEAVQHNLFLAAEEGKAPPAIMEHPRKGGGKESRCCGGGYVGAGWRGTVRRIRTEFGEVGMRVRQVMCKSCGKRFAPLLSFLSMRAKRHTSGLERVVVECITADSFRPGLRTLSTVTGIQLPATTAHHWWATGPWNDVPFGAEEAVETLMADGTGFKGRAGKKGEIKVAIGFTREGRAVGLGTWAGTSWKRIGDEIREGLKRQKEKPLFGVTDGERDLADHLAKLVNHTQRCTWHGGRDLGFALWEDGVSKPQRDGLVSELRGVLGIEIPAEDWEKVPEDKKAAVRARLDAARAQGKELEQGLRDSRCPKAAGYVARLLEKAFTHVELWLELGITLPRTTSFLEGLMFKIGRRVKKIAWNWSDDGAARMSRVLLKRALEPKAWLDWCRKQLCPEERCYVGLVSVTVSHVTGFV